MRILVNNKPAISVHQAAEQLRVSDNQVRHLIGCGKLKAYDLSPRVWLVDMGSVREYAKSDRTPGRKAAG